MLLRMGSWLEAGDARVVVDAEAGGRIAELEVAGLQLLVPREADALRWGCYPMAPFAGRVREARFRHAGREYELPVTAPPHAIHGTVHDRPWRDEGGGRLSIALGPDWPFPGRAVQQVALEPDALSLRLEVHADDAVFPASLGWHPWFRRRLARGAPARLALRARHMYVRDASGIPTGETVPPPPGPWDDCFTGLEADPVLAWAGAVELTLHSTVSHWVVYDEPEHALCVEPQTAPPDALNLGAALVEPGRPLVAEARLSFRRL